MPTEYEVPVLALPVVLRSAGTRCVVDPARGGDDRQLLRALDPVLRAA